MVLMVRIKPVCLNADRGARPLGWVVFTTFALGAYKSEELAPEQWSCFDDLPFHWSTPPWKLSGCPLDISQTR